MRDRQLNRVKVKKVEKYPTSKPPVPGHADGGCCGHKLTGAVDQPYDLRL